VNARSAATLLLAALASACTVGEGEGWVKSDKLYVEDCWNGGTGRSTSIRISSARTPTAKRAF
jgi:hypothetical protein